MASLWSHALISLSYAPGVGLLPPGPLDQGALSPGPARPQWAGPGPVPQRASFPQVGLLPLPLSLFPLSLGDELGFVTGRPGQVNGQLATWAPRAAGRPSREV